MCADDVILPLSLFWFLIISSFLCSRLQWYSTCYLSEETSTKEYYYATGLLKNLFIWKIAEYIQFALDYLTSASVRDLACVTYFSTQFFHQMLEVVQMNTTFSHQQSLGAPKKSAYCNCSVEVGKIREQLSNNKLSIESLQKELQALQSNIERLPSKE